MGFASLLESISDRYCSSSGFSEIWSDYPVCNSNTTAIVNTTAAINTTPVIVDDRPIDPRLRARRIIAELWQYVTEQEERANLVPTGYWELHYRNVDALHEILAGVTSLPATDHETWEALSCMEVRLRQFFLDNPVYGPLSPNVLRSVVAASREIRSRCITIERELEGFLDHARSLSADDTDEEVRNALNQFGEIRERLEAEEGERRRYLQCAEQARVWGEEFLSHYARLKVQVRYRPTLQNLHRLRLHDDQERFVALDHNGAYRIQGASGSGKTIILIHRALRLAQENPAAIVRVFTINRSLARLLRESIATINNRVPDNLKVGTFYDFLRAVQRKMVGVTDTCRLVDPLSGERIQVSWRDFYHHRGRRSSQTVFACPEVRNLIELLSRRRGQIDACQYLRDEVIYIQSAFRACERLHYLDPRGEPRSGRGVPLRRDHRETCLKVLEAWEEWLRTAELCDVEGLTLKAGLLFEPESQLQRVRSAFPTQHVLVDEAQDFSTMELRLLRRLVADPDGPNRFFFVGDLNQKVFAKQHHSKRAGFDLTGRSKTLAQNYRNTRQILTAACRLSEAYPPQADEPTDPVSPELSQYEGGRPIALACKPVTHPVRVVDIVQQLANQRVAVVSANETLLTRVRQEAERRGIRCYALYRVEDLDLWREQQGRSSDASLVVSSLEAVKGFEFDTVIACDVSYGVIPRPGTPPEEHWRDAAVLYAALTRARDQLVMTYVGRRSEFLNAMADAVDFQDDSIEDGLGRALR
jgi:hypothetical protein